MEEHKLKIIKSSTKMNAFNFNPGNETMSSIQTIGIEVSPNYMLPTDSIMPDRFNTIAESHNFPYSSIGKSHKFFVGGENSIEIPIEDYEERVS